MPIQSKRSVVSRLGEKIADLAKRENAGALVIAFSGGPDSTLLFHAALAANEILKKTGDVCPSIILAHLDHSLRPESADEAAAVKSLAKEHDVLCEVKRVDVGALAKTHDASIEEEGHLQRYAFFEEVRAKHRDAIVLTGHTRSDVAETVVVNLITGSGLRGAGGLSDAPDERVFRPMTQLTRAQVRRALAEAGIAASEDPSNNDPRFLRNAVRLSIVPMMERVRPGAEKALARFAEIAGDDAALIEALVGTAYSAMLHKQFIVHHCVFPPESEKFAVIDLSHLDLIFPPTPDRSNIRPTRALIRHIIRAHVRTTGLPPLRFDEVDAAASVALGPRRRHVSVHGVEFVRIGRHLLIFPTEFRAGVKPVTVGTSDKVHLCKDAMIMCQREPYRRTTIASLVVPECLFPLTLRSPAEDDEIVRYGRIRQVSDILSDARIPPEVRPMMRVTADKTGRIIWVVGHAATDGLVSSAESAEGRLVHVVVTPRGFSASRIFL